MDICASRCCPQPHPIPSHFTKTYCCHSERHTSPTALLWALSTIPMDCVLCLRRLNSISAPSPSRDLEQSHLFCYLKTGDSHCQADHSGNPPATASQVARTVGICSSARLDHQFLQTLVTSLLMTTRAHTIAGPGPVHFTGFHSPKLELEDCDLQADLGPGRSPFHGNTENKHQGTAANKPTLIDSVDKGPGSGAWPDGTRPYTCLEKCLLHSQVWG